MRRLTRLFRSDLAASMALGFVIATGALVAVQPANADAATELGRR